MANTKILIFYFIFLLFYSFFVTEFQLEKDSKSLTDYAFISKMRSNLNDADSGLSTVISVVLIPFIILDLLIMLVFMLGVSFTSMPLIINTLILSPLGALVIFDYVIPIIRGN